MNEDQADRRKTVEDSYRKYGVLVRQAAERLLLNRAAAEDVTQQVFANLIIKVDKGVTPENVRAYLCRSATNLALSILRNSKRRRELLTNFGEAEVAEATPEEALAVRKVLGLVPKQEAAAAACFYVHGMRRQAIANALGLSVRQVDRKLESFRVRSQKLLER